MMTDLSNFVEHDDVINITKYIVTEHVLNNHVSKDELCDMIETIFVKFQELSRNKPAMTYKELISSEEDNSESIA